MLGFLFLGLHRRGIHGKTLLEWKRARYLGNEFQIDRQANAASGLGSCQGSNKVGA